MTQPLQGLRVVEFAPGVSASYTGKLFADFGADVVRVEQLANDRVRTHGPFPAGLEADPEQGALHLHLNTNKRSLLVDLAEQADRSLAAELFATADLIIDGLKPGALAAAGLGPDRIRELAPACVVLAISPFGQDGPYAAMAAEDIVLYAMGGPMHATGLENREPLKLAGNQIQYQVGNVAAVAALGALTAAARSGQGIRIDLSSFEAQVGTIDRRTSYLLYHSFTGRIGQRAPSTPQRQVPLGLFPVADGYVQILTIPTWVPRMLKVLADDDLAARYASPGWPSDPELADALDGVLYPWLLSRTRDEAMAEAQAARWPLTALNSPGDLVHNEHFQQRGFWVESEHELAGRLVQPGAPFRMANGWRLRRPAPWLGQHNEEIRAELDAARPTRASAAARTAAATNSAGPRSGGLPLAGIRVIDFTVVWAGPYATLFLGDLGAEVVRVDNPWVFPTATRGGQPRPPAVTLPGAGPLGSYPDDDPGERPWNRHSMFSAHARNKLGATLDLRNDLGREMFLRLVEHSDVLVENNSVGVLEKLGLSWEVLHERNPRLILLRMPPMGLTGPYRDYLGFGAHFEALCGMTALRGYPDLDPTSTHPVFHMDPATGATGAFAAMLALRRRAETGVGELIELPQSENMLQHVGEFLLDAARTGRDHATLGNRHVSWAPQGCYACLGTPPAGPSEAEPGQWIAISVADDQQWAALKRAMGNPGWADAVAFDHATGRRAHHDTLDEHLSAWTRTLDRFDVFRRCQAEGVPAGPVLDEAECYGDEHLAARGFFRENGSADLGTHRFPGHLWRWDGPELRWGPLARMGVDNDYVWREVVGVSDAEYEALRAGGHFSLDYLRPDGSSF